MTGSMDALSLNNPVDEGNDLLQNSLAKDDHSSEHVSTSHDSNNDNQCPSPTSKNTSEFVENKDNHITKPGEHDVLLGRGGGANNHCGNIKFRKLVNEHKMRYLACNKVEKPKVAREVVNLWRQMQPPGRFCARIDLSKKGPGSVKAADNVWYEVGDKKAREKASQCLRERTADVLPYIKQLREQQDAFTSHGVMEPLNQQKQQALEEQMIRGGMGGFSPGSSSTNRYPGANVRRSSMPSSFPMGGNPRPSAAAQPFGLSSSERAHSSSHRRMSWASGSAAQSGMTAANPYAQQRRQSYNGMGGISSNMNSGYNSGSMPNGMVPNNMNSGYNRMPPNSGGLGGGDLPNQGEMSDSEYQYSLTMMQQEMQFQHMEIQNVQRARMGGQRMQSAATTNNVVPSPFGNNGFAGGSGRDMNANANHVLKHEQLMQQPQQVSFSSPTGNPNKNRPMHRPLHHVPPQEQCQSPVRSSDVPVFDDTPLSVYGNNNSNNNVREHNQVDGSSMKNNRAGGSEQHNPLVQVPLNMPRPSLLKSSPIRGINDRRQQQRQRQHQGVDGQQQGQYTANMNDGAKRSAPKRTHSTISGPMRKAPDRTPSPSFEGEPLAIGSSDAAGDEGESTLEEYRQQLEQYITDHQIAIDDNVISDGLSGNFSDDLEDDWEKEKEKMQHNSEEHQQRGIDRNTSGRSFMSIDKMKSDLSIMSGMSNLSDLLLMSDDEGAAAMDKDNATTDVSSRAGEGEQGEGVKRGMRRNVSNDISLLSELTDLSQNFIDSLSIGD